MGEAASIGSGSDDEREPLSACPSCNGLGYERQPSTDRLVRCDTCEGEGWT